MRNHKGLFFALITAITVVLSPNVSQAVDFNDLNKLSPQPAGSKRMIFSDILNGPGIVTSIMGTGYGDQFVSCKGLREGACAKASEVFSHVIVPPCNDSSKDSDVCIKDLTFINSAGSSEKAKLLYELDTRKFVADPTAKTPAGGGISVWQGNPENNSAGANTFGVRIGITYRIDYSSNSYSPGISRTDGFKAEIIPVTFKSGSQYIAMGEFEKLSNNDCAWTELGKCAVRQEFGKANPISITFQMDNRISGWLSGRMMDTSVGSKKLSATTNLLTVTGSPIDEPTGYADLTAVELAQNPDASKEFGLSNWAARPQGDRLNWQWGPYYRDISVLAANMNQDQFKVFYKEFREKYVNFGYAKVFQKYLKSYPIRNSKWVLEGLTPANFREENWPGCFEDTLRISGIVTTNAMLYDSSPPRFEDGSIVYDVAGAHEGYDGKVFKGSYDLALSSEFARCLYKFSSAPIKASISVTSSTGEVQNIATELVNEKNGWLTLSAKNFTFSAPSIKIKLSQDSPTANSVAIKEDKQPVSVAEVKVVKQPEAVKILKPEAKKTIICTKGKLIKKVTGTSPKCPSAYQKT